MDGNGVNVYIERMVMVDRCVFYMVCLFFCDIRWKMVWLLCMSMGWNMIYFVGYRNKKKRGRLIGFYGFRSVL